MQIRKATESDLPGIVQLLKESLGEGLMPKSEAYWRWKHINNPFGISPVLLAIEDDKLVGVRAFMRWQWSDGKRKVEAVRAVDTATHPDFQGKGIFSKLTKALLTDSKTDGYNLVFNTPNDKSMPGYLKMGWEKAGKLPITLKPVNPLSMVMNILSSDSKKSEPSSDGSVQEILNHRGLSQLLLHATKHNGHFVSSHSVNSLKWRYLDCPVAIYFAAGMSLNNALDGVIFYRLKVSKAGLEMRVTDVWSTLELPVAKIKKMVAGERKKQRADYVTFGALAPVNPVRSLTSITQARFAPIVTVREIQDVDLSDFRAFKRWSPSLGDLELF
jgi:N-acetylglutamate synthase-like GNAT family acetyltransferase